MKIKEKRKEDINKEKKIKAKQVRVKSMKKAKHTQYSKPDMLPGH